VRNCEHGVVPRSGDPHDESGGLLELPGAGKPTHHGGPSPQVPNQCGDAIEGAWLVPAHRRHRRLLRSPDVGLRSPGEQVERLHDLRKRALSETTGCAAAYLAEVVACDVRTLSSRGEVATA
jgi:hypothetical protein